MRPSFVIYKTGRTSPLFLRGIVLDAVSRWRQKFIRCCWVQVLKVYGGRGILRLRGGQGAPGTDSPRWWSSTASCIRITWRTYYNTACWVLPCEFLNGRGKNLLFLQVSRWSWCCWSGGSTLRTTIPKVLRSRLGDSSAWASGKAWGAGGRSPVESGRSEL